MTGVWRRALSLLRHACRKVGLPTFWHKHSPKTYTVYQHVAMLVFCRRYCTSYAEFVTWLPHTRLPRLLGLQRVPDEGTLCKEEHRLRTFMAHTAIALASAILPRHFVASADGTGLQLRHASSYYTKILHGYRRGFARFELVVWRRFIIAWDLRLGYCDELAMLRRAWRRLPRLPSTLLYDKRADSEPHHVWLERQGVHSVAPVRKRAHNGFYRRRLLRHFPQRLYNKRFWSETVNSVFKHRFGDALQASSVRGRRAEIATKIAAHNLWQRLSALLKELFNAARPTEDINTAC